MKNNWKEEFDNLMDNYLKHFADAVISKHVVQSINKEQDEILYNFIESLLAEQKKELIRKIEAEPYPVLYQSELYREQILKIIKKHD